MWCHPTVALPIRKNRKQPAAVHSAELKPPMAASFPRSSARGSADSCSGGKSRGITSMCATVTASAATAAATSQNNPLNSAWVCDGRKLTAAMLEDLLVTIIGENRPAPPNMAASRAVIAGPRSGSLRPATMSLYAGVSSASRTLVDGISGDSPYPDISSAVWCQKGLSGRRNSRRRISR